MELTKHAHACVSLEKDGRRLVIDPGSFTPDAAEVVARCEAILVTHGHPDHLNEAVVEAALEERPSLKLFGPSEAIERWRHFGDRVTPVVEGDHLEIEGFEVGVHGERHAAIHPDLPPVANVGYLIDGTIFHPGDAYQVPPSPIATLLLPISGLWTKFDEAVDYVRALNPTTVIEIHELMMSDLGLQYASNVFGQLSPADLPLTVLAVGQTVHL